MADDLLKTPESDAPPSEENFDDWAATDGPPELDETVEAPDEAVETPDEFPESGEKSTESPPVAVPTPAPTQAAPTQAAPVYGEADYATALGQVEKDLDALASRYEAGEIEFKNYRAEERKLNDLRTSFGATLVSMQTERQTRETTWDGAVQAFLKDPENSAFQSGGVLAPMMREVLQRQFANPSPGATYETILKNSAAEVKTQLRAALGLEAGKPASSSAKTAADELKARREKRLQGSVATPARGSTGAAQPDPYEGWAAG